MYCSRLRRLIVAANMSKSDEHTPSPGAHVSSWERKCKTKPYQGKGEKNSEGDKEWEGGGWGGGKDSWLQEPKPPRSISDCLEIKKKKRSTLSSTRGTLTRSNKERERVWHRDEWWMEKGASKARWRTEKSLEKRKKSSDVERGRLKKKKKKRMESCVWAHWHSNGKSMATFKWISSSGWVIPFRSIFIKLLLCYILQWHMNNGSDRHQLL